MFKPPSKEKLLDILNDDKKSVGWGSKSKEPSSNVFQTKEA